MFDPELENFKTNIDLRAYAASRGYELDRGESWQGSAVMRHAKGDKIIIKRDADSHYVYFSVRDDDDHGTIIDFASRRLALSLGAVRKELRPWIGKPASELPSFPRLQNVAKDRLRVYREFARMQDAPTHAYLENERLIPAALLASERFLGRVKIDNRGNAIFPHFDDQGLSGYEIKNTGFTGFATGGTKGLWISNGQPNDSWLVFCESAIDALSYAALFPDSDTRYASIGGKPNATQAKLICAAIARMPANADIVAAMDADAAGVVLAYTVREAFELSGREDLWFHERRPAETKDWNDQLRAMHVMGTSRQRLMEAQPN